MSSSTPLATSQAPGHVLPIDGWCTLHLSKSSVVKSEVDKALKHLAECGTKNKMKQDSLLSLIKDRIDELELFCSKNHDDEQAILFEKQSLRLRKAVSIILEQQSSKVANDGVSPAKKQSLATSPSINKNYSNKTSSIGTVFNVALVKGAFSKNTSSIVPSDPPLEQQEQEANMIQVCPAPVTTKTIQKKEKIPLYSWEVQRVPRNPISINNVTYGPTHTAGVYMTLPVSNDTTNTTNGNTSVASDSSKHKFVDFKIVLNEVEFQTLVSRKKQLSRAELKDPRNASSISCVGNATPYLEAKRIKEEIYRGKRHTDKWTGSKDFIATVK